MSSSSKPPFRTRFVKGLKKQLEGFYSTNPKHLAEDVVPGVKYTTLPKVLKEYATSPLKAMKSDWRAYGSKNPARQQAWRPSLGRIGAAANLGFTANTVRKASKLDRPEAVGSMIGSNVGMMMGGRLPILANMALWAGADAAGRKLGRMYAKRRYGYKPVGSLEERIAQQDQIRKALKLRENMR